MMDDWLWWLLWSFAAASLVGGLVLWIINSRYRGAKLRTARAWRPFYWFFAGVCVSIFCLVLPVNLVRDQDLENSFWPARVFASFNYVLQMCMLNADLAGTIGILPESKLVSDFYAVLLSFEAGLAPVLTFGLILSFFQDVFSRVRKTWHYVLRHDRHVFSALNEKSLALAASIRKRDPTAAIIFAGVDPNDEDVSSDLIRKAREMLAIPFRCPVRDIHFREHRNTKRKLCFYAIATDRTEAMDEARNITEALELMRVHGDKEYASLYVFSGRAGSEMILNTKSVGVEMTVRRINVVQSLIYQSLYRQVHRPDGTGESATGPENPRKVRRRERAAAKAEKALTPAEKARREEEARLAAEDRRTQEEEERRRAAINRENIFERAKRINPAREEKDAGMLVPITAVVVGIGHHGAEMIKALSWFCQMDGYRIRIFAFDKEKNAKDRFTALCPDLMNREFNKEYKEGESFVEIEIEDGTDVTGQAFFDRVAKIPDVSYVFICLGNDELNIRTAMELRTRFERTEDRSGDRRPIIQAVVYNSDEIEPLKSMVVHNGTQRYDIDFIGDTDNAFSEEIVVNSELEREGLKVHKFWADVETLSDSAKLKAFEDKFYDYEYNYRSSCAAAIHTEAMRSCGLDKLDAESVERMEHRRWNAWARGDGYTYSGSTAKASRNDLARMHNDLVAYEKLPWVEKRKDKFKSASPS